jgi:hypothetical protein
VLESSSVDLHGSCEVRVADRLKELELAQSQQSYSRYATFIAGGGRHCAEHPAGRNCAAHCASKTLDEAGAAEDQWSRGYTDLLGYGKCWSSELMKMWSKIPQ